MIRFYQGRTTGRYRDGRRVRLFARAGRSWAHLELGARAIGVYVAVLAAVAALAGCGGGAPSVAPSAHPAGWGATPKGFFALPQTVHGVPSAEMYDTVTLSTVPARPFALAGYTAGKWPTYWPLRHAYPQAHTVSIAIASGFHADCLDIEPGDAEPWQAGAWARADINAGFRRPCLYSDLAEMPQVRASLAAAGLQRSQYFLWLAWYRFVPGLVTGVDAVQWTDHAFGRNLDESTVSLAFLQIAQPPYQAAAPKATPKPSAGQVERLILLVRADLARHHCRTVHGRRAFRLCPYWAAEGRRLHRELGR